MKAKRFERVFLGILGFLCSLSYGGEVDTYSPKAESPLVVLSQLHENIENVVDFTGSTNSVQVGSIVTGPASVTTTKAENGGKDDSQSSRSPAVVSADEIIRVGEVVPEKFPSITSSTGESNPNIEAVKENPFSNVSGLGNAGKVFETLSKGFGKLPIPMAVVTGAPQQKVFVSPRGVVNTGDPDQSGSPYNGAGKTTFGNDASDSSFPSLIRSGKVNSSDSDKDQNLNDAKSDKEKEKEKSEEEKKKAELLDKIGDVKSLETPYTMDDYQKVRDLFRSSGNEIRDLAGKDDVFNDTAANIFKEFGDGDKNRLLQKPYRDFYDRYQDEKIKKFPSQKVEPPSRIHLESH